MTIIRTAAFVATLAIAGAAQAQASGEPAKAEKTEKAAPAAEAAWAKALALMARQDLALLVLDELCIALRYNYLEDTAPVARVISYPLGLYASPGSGAKNLKEYVELAKKNPALTLYASAGAGSITEFLGVVMSKEFGVKMTVVPFKGAGEVKNAILGSQAPVGIMAPGDIFQHVAGGRVVPLGFMTEKRWSVVPDVPTMKEQGFNVTQGEAFMGLWATTKTPSAERKKMEDAVNKVLSNPAFKNKILQANVSPDFGTGAEMDKQVRSLINFWKPVVEQSGFKP